MIILSGYLHKLFNTLRSIFATFRSALLRRTSLSDFRHFTRLQSPPERRLNSYNLNRDFHNFNPFCVVSDWARAARTIRLNYSSELCAPPATKLTARAAA
ncbi:MAG: hypothetical protein H0U87_05735 [Acidobacteria bacterium]|nr:hypothetical protein [Acidobacteriota bacterium]